MTYFKLEGTANPFPSIKSTQKIEFWGGSPPPEDWSQKTLYQKVAHWQNEGIQNGTLKGGAEPEPLPFRPEIPVYRVIFGDVLNYRKMIDEVGRACDHDRHYGQWCSVSSFAWKIELVERKSKRV